MKTLEEHLVEHFGAPRPEGERIAAVSDVHAVHEAGFDVHYTRYSVTYRDEQGERVFAAELDEDGVLVIQSSGRTDRAVAERLTRALDFLEVRHRHR